MDLDGARMLAAMVVALVCAGLGLAVPWLIARLPEPTPDPGEDPADFPDKVPYAELGARRQLRLRSAAACGTAGALLGAALGWSWALPWLVFLVPVCCALTVIDYVTWYLPTRLIAPSYLVVSALVALGAVATGDVRVLLAGVLGAIGLGGYYGLLWFISPRMMAFGDVRLAGLLGLALGPFGTGTVILSVLLAGVIGVLGYLPLRRVGNAIRRHVPFGPFLVLGALGAVVLGQALAAA